MFPRDEDRTDAGARTALDAPAPRTADQDAAAAAGLLDRTAAEDWSLFLPTTQAVHDRRRSLRRARWARHGLALAAVAGVVVTAAPRPASSRPVSPGAVSPSPKPSRSPAAAPSSGHKPGTTNPPITDPGMIKAFEHSTVVGSGTTGGHAWQVRVVVYDRPGEVPASIKQQFFFGPGDPVTTGHPVAAFGLYEAGVLTGVRVSAPAHDIPDLDLNTAADMVWIDDESEAVFSLPVGANVAGVVVSSSPTAKRTFPTVEVQGYRFVSIVLEVTVDEQLLSLDGSGAVVNTRTLASRPPL